MNKRSLLAGPYIVWIIGFTVLPLLMIIFMLSAMVAAK